MTIQLRGDTLRVTPPRMSIGFGRGSAPRRPFLHLTMLWYSPTLWTVRLKFGGLGRWFGVYVSRRADV